MYYAIPFYFIQLHFFKCINKYHCITITVPVLPVHFCKGWARLSLSKSGFTRIPLKQCWPAIGYGNTLENIQIIPSKNILWLYSWCFSGGDVCVSGHDSGPVFEEQPSSLIYPEGMPEGKVTLSCQARASPAAIYRYSDHIFGTHTLSNKTEPNSFNTPYRIFSQPNLSLHFILSYATKIFS